MKNTKRRIGAIILMVMLAVCSVFAICFTAQGSATTVTPNYNFIKVVHGKGHTLALNSKGELFGWGQNDEKQVANSTDTYIASPKQIFVSGNIEVIDIAATDKSSVAIIAGGDVYGWGSGKNNQNGTHVINSNIASPAAIRLNDSTSLRSATAVSAGAEHYVVATADINGIGTLYGWGSNSNKQLSYTKTETALPPFQMSSEKISPKGAFASGKNTYFVTMTSFDSGNTNWSGGSVFGMGEGFSTITNVFNPLNVSAALYIPSGNVISIQGLNISDGSFSFVERDKTSGAELTKRCIFTLDKTGIVVDTDFGVTFKNKTDNIVGVTIKRVAAASNGALAFLSTTGKVYVSGADYGIGELLVENNVAKEVVFIGDGGVTGDAFNITSVYGGELGFAALDNRGNEYRDGAANTIATKAGGVHMFGQKTEDTKHKYPVFNNSEISDRNGNFAVRYNFFSASNNTALTQNNKIAVYTADNNGLVSDTKAEYIFKASDLMENLVSETGKGGLGLTTYNDKLAIYSGNQDVTTAYGVATVRSAYIVEVEHADTVQIISSIVSGENVIAIRGLKKLTKDTVFTVRIPVLEYANDIGKDIVALHYVNVTFTYGNWTPTVDTSADSAFSGDVNAKSVTGAAIVFSSGSEDFSYKQKDFSASSLVIDKDNNQPGVNNNPNSLKFLSAVAYGSGIDSTNIDVSFNETRTHASLKAKKSFSGEKTITLTVEDDFGAKVQVTIKIKIEANASDYFIRELNFGQGVQGGNANTINLADIYEDKGTLQFANLSYNADVLSVAISEDKQMLTVKSKFFGASKVVCDVINPYQPQDSSRCQINVSFSVNAVPQLKAGAALKFENFSSITRLSNELFTDAEGDAITMVVLSYGSKNVIFAETINNGQALVVKPLKQGKDVIVLSVSDGASKAVTYEIPVQVENAYVAPEVKIGMLETLLNCSYLATFVNDPGFTIAQLQEATYKAVPEENDVAKYSLSVDNKVLTILPKNRGSISATITIIIGGSERLISLPIVVNNYLPSAVVHVDVAQLKAENKGTKYNLSIKSFIETLGIIDNNGNILNSGSYVFSAVHLRGTEQYAVAYVDTNNTFIVIDAMQNTPDITQTSSGGSANMQYIDVVIKEISTGKEYFITMPITVSGLKTFPTFKEYQMILYISLGSAVFVVLVLIIIACRIYAVRSKRYRKEIDRAKIRDQAKKAVAMGVTSRQTASMLLGRNGGAQQMSVPRMPNSAGQPTRPGQPMHPNMGGSGMNPMFNPNQANMGNVQNPNFGTLTITGEGGQPRMTEMPPLKANQNVPHDARAEIDNKIQQRLREQGGQPPRGMNVPDTARMQQQHSQQLFDATEQKLSKKDQKKKEMMDKLRAKMMANRK